MNAVWLAFSIVLDLSSPLFQIMRANDTGLISSAIQARGNYRPSIDEIACQLA